MFKYLALVTLVLAVGMILARVIILRSKSIQAVKFGDTDKRDFLLMPFALLYFYLVLSHAVHWPTLGRMLFTSAVAGGIGVVLAVSGLTMVLMALIAFGTSFRVGIDEEHPGPLVTSGIFAVSRNPIYTGMAFVVTGIFFMVPDWILLLYVLGGYVVFHRQVRLEEASLRHIYGTAYEDYCRRVRRYL